MSALATPVQKKQLNILLANEDRVFHQEFAYFCEHLRTDEHGNNSHFRMSHALCGNSALAHLQVNKYDATVLRSSMPRRSAVLILEEMAGQDYATPVIVLLDTDFKNGRLVRYLEMLGATPVFLPVDDNELASAIEFLADINDE